MEPIADRIGSFAVDESDTAVVEEYAPEGRPQNQRYWPRAV